MKEEKTELHTWKRNDTTTRIAVGEVGDSRGDG